MTTEDLARRAFQHYAREAKQPGAKLWRAWTRWLEPVLVSLFVVLFVSWALATVFGH